MADMILDSTDSEDEEDEELLIFLQLQRGFQVPLHYALFWQRQESLRLARAQAALDRIATLLVDQRGGSCVGRPKANGRPFLPGSWYKVCDEFRSSRIHRWYDYFEIDEYYPETMQAADDFPPRRQVLRFFFNVMINIGKGCTISDDTQ